MEKRFVLRGLASGALAGLFAFVFARLLTEPIIQRAIDYESGRDAAQHALNTAAGIAPEHEGHELFTRGVQSNIGLAIGLILFAIAMAGIFTVVFVVALKRSEGKIPPRRLALMVAGGLFLAVFLVPYLKYPGNPPAVGHEETIGARTALYLGMTLVSVVAALAALISAKQLRARLGEWNGNIVAAACFIVVVSVAMVLLPALGHLQANVDAFGRHATETPLPLLDPSGTIVFPGFPADDLAKFRIYSLLNMLLIWSTIGLTFGALAERMLAPAGRKAAVDEHPPMATSAA